MFENSNLEHPNLEVLVKDIYSRLCDEADELYSLDKSRKIWTDTVKAAISGLAKKYGYKVWGHKPISEWLFDLVWVAGDAYDREDEVKHEWWHNFDGCRLVCEIEWDKAIRSHMTDFLKLTVAMADLRVFIYATDADDVEEEFNLLVNHSKHCYDAHFLAIPVPFDSNKCLEAETGICLPMVYWVSSKKPEILKKITLKG